MTRGLGLGGHQSAAADSIEWYTPRWVFEALGMEFELDPCSPPFRLPWIPARRFYSASEDGLMQPWSGSVWMNPPYGRSVGWWMRRLAAHGDGIALVPGRTDTDWYHESAPAALVKCELRGRVTFVDRDHRPGHFNSGAPTILLAYGEVCAEAVRGCGLGLVLSMPRRPVGGQVSLL